MKSSKFLLELLCRQYGPFAAALALSLLTLLAGVALLGVSGWFLTAAALTTMAASFNLFGPSSLIRGLSLIRILSRYGEKLVGHDATLRLLTDLRTRAFRGLFARQPSETQVAVRNDLVSRLTADIDALEVIFIIGIAPLITSLLSAMVMATILGFVLPQALVPYSLAAGLAVLIAPAVLFMASRRLGILQAAANADARGQLLNILDAHADIAAFGRTGDAQLQFGLTCRRLSDLSRRLALRASLATTAIQLLTCAGLLAVLAEGTTAFRAGILSAPVLVGLLLATLASFEGAVAVIRGIARFGAALAAAERVGDLVARKSAAKSMHLPMPQGSRLTVDRVGFGYERARPVLRNLSLTVAHGERVVLVGRSGCGKSTLLSLLIGLHGTQFGEIRLDGVSTAALDPDALRTRIALLAQDAPVFMGTIRDNLLIGDPDADDDRLMSALTSVRLARFVRELPGGLDTYVGETGRTLSMGQVRRLCLARVLLSKAEILLLDEPTSSLDQETEAAFFADLASIAHGRTIIVATHASPAVLGGFDQRYHMQNGLLMPL